MKRLRASGKFILQWGVIAILCGFVLRYLHTQWSQLDVTLTPDDWLRLAAAQGLFIVGMGLLPLNSWLMQRWFGYVLAPVTMWHSFYVAQLAKYLPGGIWSIPGRALLYRRGGIPSLESGTLVALEMLGMIAGAGTVGLLSLPVFLPLVAPHLGWVAAAGLTAVVAAGVGIYALRMRLKPAADALRRIRPAALLAVCAVYGLNWVVLGLAFAVIPSALHQPLDAASVLQVIGVHAVAWVVGFVVIFAPGGIGVRDGLLTVGLIPFLPMPLPVMVSLMARIAWTLAEVTGFALVTLYQKSTGRKADETHHPDTLF